MRLIRLSVGEKRRDAVVDVLHSENIDYVTTRGGGATKGSWVLEFPLPTDAVGDVLDMLREAGVDDDDYLVVSTAEAAMTPHSDDLMNRYASTFDPLSRPEIRSKARDLSFDSRSYYAMVGLSAVIATVGLLTGSAAVIVGSMVIAPLVGPILTLGVGTVTDDRSMVVDSLRMQASGLVVTVVTAALAGYLLQFVFLVPPGLDVTSVQSISSRAAPDLMSVGVGLLAGCAAAYSLATKGPTALIGVMIAAALIPTAAGVGIGIVWGDPVVAIGALLLLVATVVAINAGVLGVLWSFGYRPARTVNSLRDAVPSRTVVASLVVLFVVVGGAVTVGTYGHWTFETATNHAVNDALEEPRYDQLGVISTRPQYGGPTPLDDPKSVTVVLSTPSRESYPNLADAIRNRIQERTGDAVAVRVRFVRYQTSRGEAASTSG